MSSAASYNTHSVSRYLHSSYALNFSPPSFPSTPPITLLANSPYLNTSPLAPFATPSPPCDPKCIPFFPPANALRPTNPPCSSTASTSRALSPGLVCNRASRSSNTSIWPLSSSSKAENAERSSDDEESGARRDARVERKVGRESVGEDGGK